MLVICGLLVILATVVIILRRGEVRLSLLLSALTLGALAGKPMVIVQTFLIYFTSEQFLLPIGCCMGFAYVLKHTGCDGHLVRLLLRPLTHARPLLLPGIVMVGVLVNVPIISQSSTAIAVGAVLVPVLSAARLPPVTIGAALALGASIGGELLNPGAPELRTVSVAAQANAIDCVAHVWPLLLVHLGVAVPLFWWLNRHDVPPLAEASAAEATPEIEAANPLKALVPLVPLALLFLTALPPPLRAFDVPREWLVTPDQDKSFDVRLIGAAMLVGVVVAALTDWPKAAQTGKVFFEGAGYAVANVTSLIVCANCFGKGVELVGLAEELRGLTVAFPNLLFPLAALLPLVFGWVSGSGMAATQSLFGFFVAPAQELGIDPLEVGAVVSLAAAAGRTSSPVAAVVLMSASLTGADPLAMVRKIVVPLLAGLLAVVVVAMVL